MHLLCTLLAAQLFSAPLALDIDARGARSPCLRAGFEKMPARCRPDVCRLPLECLQRCTTLAPDTDARAKAAAATLSRHPANKSRAQGPERETDGTRKQGRAYALDICSLLRVQHGDVCGAVHGHACHDTPHAKWHCCILIATQQESIRSAGNQGMCRDGRPRERQQAGEACRHLQGSLGSSKYCRRPTCHPGTPNAAAVVVT